MEQITAIESFLDFVIEDTEAGMLKWNCMSIENLAIFTTHFQIRNTDKFLKFKLYSMGEQSYIEVYFYIHPQIIIPFEKIKYKNSSKKMEQLIEIITNKNYHNVV